MGYHRSLPRELSEYITVPPYQFSQLLPLPGGDLTTHPYLGSYGAINPSYKKRRSERELVRAMASRGLHDKVAGPFFRRVGALCS